MKSPETYVSASVLMERYGLTRREINAMLPHVRYKFSAPKDPAVLLVEEVDAREWVAAKVARALEREAWREILKREDGE